MGRNHTITHKGLILVSVPLLFQLAFIGVLVWMQQQNAEAQRWSFHSQEVLRKAHAIQEDVVSAAGGVRGWVVTDDSDFVQPYEHDIQEVPGMLDQLQALVQDNPDQQSRAAQVRAKAEEALAQYAAVAQLMRAGQKDEAVARLKTREGKRRIDELRQEMAAFRAEEERLGRVRAAALARSWNWFSLVLAAGGVIAFVSSLLLAYLFYREIGRRLAVLTDNAHRLAVRKELQPPLSGNDEIAQLDHAFRDMAATMTRASDEIRDLYDNAPCGYHSVDPSGTVIAVNQTELQWLGYESNELVGRKRFAELITPSSRNEYQAAFTRVKEWGAASDVELELRRKDGTCFPVLLNSTAVRDGQGRYLRSRTTLTDLTERKRTDAAIQLFANVVHYIPLGLLIYQLDEKGEPPVLRVRSGNSSAARLLGIPLEHAVGRAVAEVFPALPQEVIQRYMEVATSGRAGVLEEITYGDARVAERCWSVHTFPLPERSVGVAFQDVSDRKRAEAEVHRLNAELEVRVHERTAELVEANRDLRHKNTENEMFVYSVSHDLRSPLVNLQGFSKELEKGRLAVVALLEGEAAAPPILRDQGLSLLNGKMAKSVGFIQSAVMRLSGIIDAMLRLSRAGRVEYRWDAVDLAQVVSQVVAATQAIVAERGAAVQVGELPPAWGDRTAIEQVFGNLIGNALTYLDPARPGVIEVGCLPAGWDGVPEGFRAYFVRDNGLGIPEAHRAKIFQAFQRAHPGIGKGEGLGLAIVSRIAERHRGRVWVESKAGEGSTFYVTLPAAEGGRSAIPIHQLKGRPDGA